MIKNTLHRGFHLSCKFSPFAFLLVRLSGYLKFTCMQHYHVRFLEYRFKLLREFLRVQSLVKTILIIKHNGTFQSMLAHKTNLMLFATFKLDFKVRIGFLMLNGLVIAGVIPSILMLT